MLLFHYYLATKERERKREKERAGKLVTRRFDKGGIPGQLGYPAYFFFLGFLGVAEDDAGADGGTTTWPSCSSCRVLPGLSSTFF